MRRCGICGEWNCPWWYPYHFCKQRLGSPTVEDWKAFREGAGFQTKETALGRFEITPNEDE